MQTGVNGETNPAVVTLYANINAVQNTKQGNVPSKIEKCYNGSQNPWQQNNNIRELFTL